MRAELGADPGRYDAASVRLLRRFATASRSHARALATSMRMYLRFLAARGECPPALVGAVPTAPGWRLCELPRYVPAGDIERVIASCNVTTPVGLRDRAILLLLARLALRAGDVVHLRLSDLDWENARVRVCGKSRREAGLPLPQDAGDAVLDYIEHARPRIGEDRVFLTVRAPYRPFTSSNAVTDIVIQALKRAGMHDVKPKGAYLVPRGHARSPSPHRPPSGARPRVEGFVMTELASHLGVFLREHLPRDRNASRHTVQSYADSFQLLVCFAAERLGVRPCRIEVEQLTAPLILDFLDSLERERNNTIGTRNVRLAAFKSFFRYLEFRVPACLDLARQVHAIPTKRGDEAMVESLNRDEVWVLLDAPDPTTAAGVRDRAMLHLTYAAGLRVSELIGLMYTDLARPHLDTVRVTGKGRRERVLPLWKETRAALRDWLCVRPDTGQDHLFLNARGKAMTRHGFAHRLELHATTARQRMPSMTGKRIFPHLLRHSCAAHTLEATGDIRKVSLWLGHASIQSTEIYLRSDPIGKLEVLAARVPPALRKGSFKQAPDRLLAILNDARAR